MLLIWLRYLLGAALAAFGLAQLYLLIAYSGRAPISGSFMAPNPSLRATAVKSLVGATLAIPIILWARWPALITYLLALGVLGRLVDLYRCALALPPFAELARGGAFELQRKRQIGFKVMGALVGVALLAGSALLFGH